MSDKEIEGKISSGALWDDLLQGAVFGEFTAEHIVIVREYNDLLKQAEELGNENLRLSARFRDSVIKWLTLARGTEYQWPDGFTPDELHHGTRMDETRDEEVYRLILKQEAFNRAIFELDGKINLCVGELFRQALNTGDMRPLRLLEALVGLFRSRQDIANPRYALYLRVIGKDDNGKVRPTTIWSVSALALICRCDRKTIRDWCNTHGVTPTPSKRGRPKKV